MTGSRKAFFKQNAILLLAVLLIFTGLGASPLNVYATAESSNAAQEGEVSVTLGPSPETHGISPRAGDYEAGLQTGTLDGKNYWKTNRGAPSPQTLYFYMNVDDAFLYDNGDQDVYITVEYYDAAGGQMVLQYDAQSAAFKDAPLFRYGDTRQWQQHTFKLTDAKFANRSNGADFRLGISGAGAAADNPDLTVASVTVKKVARVPGSGSAAVVETRFATDDVVISAENVTDYGAKADGVTDDTSAVQQALDAAGSAGGGVVFMPAGVYKIAGHLLIPTGVTLRGDWADPAAYGGAVQGTVLAAYEGRGNEAGTSFIRMEPASGVTHLSVWYPEQTLSSPAAYPWTFEQLSGDSATVENVTLVNAYNGIKIGPDWNELHYVKNVYGTALHTGIFLDYTTDIGRLERVTLNPGVWAGSGLPGAPDQQALQAYMTAHAEGVVMGRSDWEYMSDLNISGFKTGLRVTTRTGSLETANAQLYRIHVADCAVALQIEGVNDYGLLITDSSFAASAGENPVAVRATDGFHSIVQFNTVKIGGSPVSGVVNDGDGVLSFENSTFENWDAAAGGSAIVMNEGSLLLGQTSFAGPQQHVRLGTGAKALNAINSGNAGRLDVTGQTGGADVHVRFSDSYALQQLPQGIATDAPARPKPASARLFNVAAAPYNADSSGQRDAAAAVRQALSDAGAAGGGTVYLPAGIYRIDSPLVVPSGVELRGSWDVPHHTIGGGSVIFTNYGENDQGAAALITLQATAGVRGLSVYYDQQDFNAIKPYAWTIQGQGHGVYAIDTTLVNPYQGIDFGTYDTSGHYIDYVAGSPLKEGIFVGGGAKDGYLRNVQFNPHYYGRSTYPNHPEGDGFNKVWDYQKENLDAFRIGDAQGETVFNTFVYGSEYGIHFAPQNGHGPAAVVVGHGTDGSKKGAVLEQAAPQGLSLINTELVSLSSENKVYVEVEPGFASQAVLFNSAMWGDTTHAMDISGGKIDVQQANVVTAGSRGLGALGGDIAMYDSYFQQAKTTHVYAAPEIDQLVLTNNLYSGGLQLDNQAGFKVTGTDLFPVQLKLNKQSFDAAHPERSLSTLQLANASAVPQSGKLTLLEPSAYSGTQQPIRFKALAPGQMLEVALPFLTGDTLKYRIDTDNGDSFTASLNLAETFASREGSGAGEAAPPVELADADHYSSLGGEWKGVGDLSAEADVRWDDSQLYVTVRVKDDVHAQNWSGGDIWQGDSLQLGIDLSRADGAASANVSELGFALGGPNGQQAVNVWRWRAPEGLQTGAVPEIKADIARSEQTKETVYELDIPFSVLHGPGTVFNPADARLGFALLINENDGSGRSGYMEYNQGIGSSKDATGYGDLYLLRGSYAEALEAPAEKAVAMAESMENATGYDAAVNFVALLPEGELKHSLDARLAALKAKLEL